MKTKSNLYEKEIEKCKLWSKKNAGIVRQPHRFISQIIANGLGDELFERFKMIVEYFNKCKSTKGFTKEKLYILYKPEDAEKRWKQYCDKQAITNTFEYKHQKYGMNEEEFGEYNKSRAVTLENLIKRHGEEKGREKWEKYCARQVIAGCKVEYFIDKYGKEKGIQEYERINKLKGLTLENFQRKYGEIEGKIRYEQWLVKQSTKRTITVSNVSQKFFWEIYDKMPDDLKNEVTFAEHGGEFPIFHKTRSYFLDFYIPSLSYCVEFNGDYYHANPKKYKAEDIINLPGYQVKVAELWKRDEERKKFLEDCGFEVAIVWESEYNKMIPFIINRIEELYESKKEQ